MRLFLDAHVSARRIATALRDSGHDVRAADEERIMVTFNARDFARIAQEWAGEGRHHTGCAIFVAIDHSEFGVILARLAEELAARPDALAWHDYTAFVGRHPPRR
jgi:hypothetical protein